MRGGPFGNGNNFGIGRLGEAFIVALVYGAVFLIAMAVMEWFWG